MNGFGVRYRYLRFQLRMGSKGGGLTCALSLSAHLASGGRAVDVHQRYHADVFGEQHGMLRIARLDGVGDVVY